jgi:hypothetical protein
VRGAVVHLTPDQVVNRALYLAGERALWDLDEHVRKRDRILDGEPECPVIYYRLEGHNGGTDPFAPDCASHWQSAGGNNNVTSDCVGGAAWCSGFDRYQPERFAHIYSGWINTDSMLMDARGPGKCFEDVGRPELGTMIVCRSGTRGHTIGHVGIVVGYKLAEWNPDDVACWEAIDVVDVAARAGRANRRTTGRGWYGTGAGFLRQTMAGRVSPLRDLALVAAVGVALVMFAAAGQLS